MQPGPAQGLLVKCHRAIDVWVKIPNSSDWDVEPVLQLGTRSLLFGSALPLDSCTRRVLELEWASSDPEATRDLSNQHPSVREDHYPSSRAPVTPERLCGSDPKLLSGGLCLIIHPSLITHPPLNICALTDTFSFWPPYPTLYTFSSFEICFWEPNLRE